MTTLPCLKMSRAVFTIEGTLGMQASEVKIHPVFLVVPVSVAASCNVILPVSLPLLMLREALDIPFYRMVRTTPERDLH